MDWKNNNIRIMSYTYIITMSQLTDLSNISPPLFQKTSKVAENIKEEGSTKETIEDGCEHNIVYDNIDITPEKSLLIQYCDKCWDTFK
jgi:hypothetical protein